MTRDASIGPIAWADGHYLFKMGWEQLALLQEATDCGPLYVLDRLAGRNARLEDISNTIRLGLIGGGVDPVKALNLVTAYVQSRPMLENIPLAYAVLAAGVQGAPDEPLGEAQGEEKGGSSTTSPEESGASA